MEERYPLLSGGEDIDLSSRLSPDVSVASQAEAALLSCSVASCKLGRVRRRWERMEAKRANATGGEVSMEVRARD
jgi:hypothetical protein